MDKSITKLIEEATLPLLGDVVLHKLVGDGYCACGCSAFAPCEKPGCRHCDFTADRLQARTDAIHTESETIVAALETLTKFSSLINIVRPFIALHVFMSTAKRREFRAAVATLTYSLRRIHGYKP